MATSILCRCCRCGLRRRVQRGAQIGWTKWLIGLIGCLSFVGTVAANEESWLTSDELGRYCLALDQVVDRSDGIVCIAYLQGFLAGTRLARGPQASAEASAESFAERAIRTRAGSYLRRIEEGRSGDYCIRGDVAPGEVVDAIVAYLDAHPDASEVAPHNIVHETLMRQFPCNEE